MVALLLGLGLDPNHQDDDGNTPLHLAAQRRRGSLAVVKAF